MFFGEETSKNCDSRFFIWFQSVSGAGARGNGLLHKTNQILWQKLDEVEDFEWFPVKKRPPFFYFCWVCGTSARLRRRFLMRRCCDSGREKRLPGLSTAPVAVNENRTRNFARVLHFQLAIGSFPALRPNRAHSCSGVESTVTGAMFLASNLRLSSGDSYRRREKTRHCRCGLPRRVFWWLLIGEFWPVVLRVIFGDF
jgi:hypothetical protein